MGVIKARRENKVYTITEQQKERYLQEGYDIYDGEGNLTEHSPKKKISYSEYEAVCKERDTLKEDGGGDNPDVISILTVYAQEHGIDLGKSTSQSGILKKIKDAQKVGE